MTDRASASTIRTLTKAHRGDLLALTALLLMVAVHSWNRLTIDLWLARHDLLAFFLPWYGHLGERLRDFDVPGWNPYLFSGTPFAGDPESGWMYLPAMLFFPLLPVLTAFKAMVVIQLAVAAFSTYAFARVLRMGLVASLVAAVVFAFGPFIFHDTYCCTVRAQLATWLPLALLGVELALRAVTWRERLVPWCICGFAISQMLAGWMGQGVINGLLVVASYLGFRALISPPISGRLLRERIVAGVATGAAVLILGVALGAAGLLLRLDVNEATNLAGGDYDALGQPHKATPYTLDTLLYEIVGNSYHQRDMAPGGAALVLTLLAPFLARRRFGVPYFAGLTFVVYALTQEKTLLHELFYLIPRYQTLHEHSQHQVTAVVMIGPAMLAAATVETLRGRVDRRRLLPFVFLPLPAIVLTMLWVERGEREIGWPPFMAAAAVTALVALVVAAPPESSERSVIRRVAAVAPALILVVAFMHPAGEDLLLSATDRPPESVWRAYWRSTPPFERSIDVNVAESDPGGAGEFLQLQQEGAEPFRYVGYGGRGHPSGGPHPRTYMDRRREVNIQAILVNARAIPLDLQHIQGYNPLQLKRYVEYVTAMNGEIQNYHVAELRPNGVESPLLDLLNVYYIIVDRTVPPDREDVVALTQGRREVFRNEQVIVYENADALPRAWIVYDVRQVERGEALSLQANGSVDPRETALIEGGPPPIAAPPASAGIARVTAFEPDALTIETQTDSPGFLVVSEVYNDGWRAYVDGESAEIVPTNHTLRGVAVPAGTHVVEMRYEPRSLRVGLWISGITAVGMLSVFGIAGWTKWRHRQGLPAHA